MLLSGAGAGTGAGAGAGAGAGSRLDQLHNTAYEVGPLEATLLYSILT